VVTFSIGEKAKCGTLAEKLQHLAGVIVPHGFI
jgi:hypothetical protein